LEEYLYQIATGEIGVGSKWRERERKKERRGALKGFGSSMGWK
jgi:hypothetical protein